MSEYLFILLIVAGVAGFIVWNSRKGKSEAVPVQTETPPAAATSETSTGTETGVARYVKSLPAQAAATSETAVETGVARYVKNMPPPPVETGVARYLRKLPKPAPETGVTRYLKGLPQPEKAETGVSRYVNAVSASSAVQRAEQTLEKLIASIPAPTHESGVARYLKTVHGV